MSLADRIQEVMGEMLPGEFARACNVSAGAVTQWTKGDTKTLRAEPVAHMEAKFGYRASWVVLGKGPKKVTDRVDYSWRFSDELAKHLLLLNEEELDRLESVMRAHIGINQKHVKTVETGRSNFYSDAYAGATKEADVGLPNDQEVPTSKTHGKRQRNLGSARKAGRSSP